MNKRTWEQANKHKAGTKQLKLTTKLENKNGRKLEEDKRNEWGKMHDKLDAWFEQCVLQIKNSKRLLMETLVKGM